MIPKWHPKKPISAIYFDGEKERYYIKRFLVEVPDKEEIFITENPKSQLEIIATDYRPMAEVLFSKRNIENQKINFQEFISIKGIKAQGNQLTLNKIKQVNLLPPLPYTIPKEKSSEEIDVVDEEVVLDILLDDLTTINKASVLDNSSKEDKKIELLKKAIQKKKDNKEDDTQHSLF